MPFDWFKKAKASETTGQLPENASLPTSTTPISTSSSSGTYTNIPDLRHDLVEYVKLRDEAAKEVLKVAWPKILASINGKYTETSKDADPEKMRKSSDITLIDYFTKTEKLEIENDSKAHSALKAFLETAANITRGPKSFHNVQLDGFNWESHGDGGMLAINYELAHAISRQMGSDKYKDPTGQTIMLGVELDAIKLNNEGYDLLNIRFPEHLIKEKYVQAMDRSVKSI